MLGVLMILMALFQMNVLPKNLIRGRKDGWISRIISDVIGSRAPEARFLIGLLTPLLPCGLLYGMAAHAAASSSPVTGGLEMAAFAAGSAPALLLTGVLSGILSSRVRKLGTTFAALIIIAMGILTIGRGAGFYKGGELFHSTK